ncbi:xanthine dehydrogenase family protein molybdopterin-binding subunit [Sphingobium sp. H39-3-25]|uniref:xanthine dehydrogenase family protein molybdopterin-binding subunit n=1 Tax=Sphingobium arseniciresistens TaxID=3030834 RepID=UPI0023B9D2AE|nr:xanthine dehydrogenase family protein molybdopterin-binding subunit [Sphingobium arseniciresistens]
MNAAKSNYVGSAVPRREDERLLRGQALFIDDVPEPFGTLSLAFLRSPYPHARILSIDVTEALAAKGVVKVYTGADIAAKTKPFSSPVSGVTVPLVRPHLAVDMVRYVGEPIAVVVAENAYLAEDALELIDIDFEQIDPIVTVADALDPAAGKVHDYLPGNQVFNMKYEVPGTDEVFKTAPHVVSGSFHSGRVSAVAMETRGFLTNFDRGTNKLDHISTAHLPHKMRWEVAECLGLPEKNVRVVAPQVGGSFGMKTVTYTEDVVGAFVSRELNRPIKWLQDRMDDLTMMQGRDFHFDVEMAYDDDGIILAVKNNIIVDIGAYPLWVTTCGIEAGGAGHHMMGPYKVDYYSYDASSVVTNKAPTSSIRGVAAPMCVFSTEMLLAKIGQKLGIDPIALRRRNLIKPVDLPFKNAVGVVHDSASHGACLDRALDMIGYDAFKAAHDGSLESDGKYRGIGVVCVTDHTGQGTSIARARGQASRWPGYDGASLRMEPDGKVIAYVSLASQGQGHETVFAQIIADRLGMSISDITVEQGDTATMPFGTGAGASRGAVAGGGAVIKASERVADKLRRIAAHLLQVSVDDIVLRDGKAMVAGTALQHIDIARIAETAYMIGPADMPAGETIGIEALEYFDPPTSSYSNATHAVCVAVDAATAQVTIEKYVVAHDCGTVLNPMIVSGQVVGATAQGIGNMLMEQLRFSDEGQPVTTTMLDYVIPTFLDVPNIQLTHMESPSSTNPGGMKGAGEGGVVGAVPVLALALTDALKSFNPDFTHIPIMPDMLLDLIHP